MTDTPNNVRKAINYIPENDGRHIVLAYIASLESQIWHSAFLDDAAIKSAIKSFKPAPRDLDLRPFGFTPGNYLNICIGCSKEFNGSEECRRCCACARLRKVETV